MSYQLTGDQMQTAMRRISEVLRQLGQAEYPFDPERLNGALQAITEGRFEDVGDLFPSEVHAAALIPKEWTIVEDVEPTPDLKVEELEFISFLEQGESYVGGEVMRGRAKKLGANLGLADGKRILEQEDKIPVELHGQIVIVLLGTVLTDADGVPRVACFRWNGNRWCLCWYWLDGGWDGSYRLARRKFRAA